MNPHRIHVKKLRAKQHELEEKRNVISLRLIGERDNSSLCHDISIVDNYLLKARPYHYRGYFFDDWKKIFKQANLEVALDSILYIESIGTRPLANFLNKTSSRLEKVNPWSSRTLELDILSVSKKLGTYKARRIFRSERGLRQLELEKESFEKQLFILQQEEIEMRYVLNESRSRLRKYINQWKRVETIDKDLKKLCEVIEKEKPYEKSHDVVYAKAARADGKTRGYAASIRKMVPKGICCPYCTGSLGNAPHLDHIQPVIRGGLSNISNLIWCCSTCNLKKSDLGLYEFTIKYDLDISFICKALLKQGKRI